MIKRPKFQLTFPNTTLRLGDQTRIMGIVNVTPDSFSKDGCMRLGSKHSTQAVPDDFTRNAINRAQKLIREGADIIDIGGESSRPGAPTVSAKEEARRIIPAITKLCRKINVPVSVDTYKSSVAKAALDAGAVIVNNIKGTQNERSLLRMISRYKATVVLMHMRGTPRSMQKNIVYRDLIRDIFVALRNSVEKCLDIGIKSDKIIIDPGIGFGKTVAHNLQILQNITFFQQLKKPILIGTSRKSFIGEVLDKDSRHRQWGTAATVCAAVLQGAHIVRVHDVRPMHDVTRMTDAIRQPANFEKQV